ncbi:MAG: magnesium transporter [Clostridiales bacterium]|nr:magnesium transporter [Clostridiales bacterium]MDY4007552.1 magnesium transporter [Candidatus Limiplasma sp.]
MNKETAVVNARPDYKADIAEIVRGNLSPKLMRSRILDYHENDIAAALSMLNRDERKKLYSVLDIDALSAVLEYADEIGVYLEELTYKKRIEVLSRIEVASAVAYLKTLDKRERNSILELMDDGPQNEIRLLASFDEDEIGSRMTTNYISIANGTGVRQAMHELVEQAAVHDNISTIYVIDQDGIFYGAIDLKDLIVARDGQALEDITVTSYPYVYANELVEDCIDRIKGYSEDSIPVLDADNRLKGVLTAQDIAELIDDEMGEDYAKLAGLTAEEDLREPLLKSIAKRLPWLIVLLGLGLIVSSVVGLFETVVASLPLVVCFQSLILDMAGNVGTQSLAVTIRVLMDERLPAKQKLFFILKESRVGLCNGFILGVLSFAVIGLYLFLLKGETATLAFSVSFCIGIALLVAMFLSSISGTGIPMLFKKLKIDPAVASGPLITTINDLIAVVTYYGLSWILLINVLCL